MWFAAASRARLPVVLYGTLTPPGRNGHHQRSAEPGNKRFVRSAQLDESCVNFGRSPGPQTDGFELTSQFLELFWRQPIDGRIGRRMEHLSQIDRGVSRNRKREVRLPARHLFDPDDDQRGDVEDAGQRRDPRLALMLRPEECENGIRDVTLEEL